MARETLFIICGLLTKVFSAVLTGPMELVNLYQDMRFEYKDSFTLFVLTNKLCEGSLLATRQNSFTLKLLAGQNIKFMMITDAQISVCREFNWVGCPLDTPFCQYFSTQTLVEKIKNDEDLLSFSPCTDELFIYIFPELRDEPAQAVIYATPSTKECVPQKLDYCVAQGYERCRNNVDSNCGTVTCIMNQEFYKGYCYQDMNEQTAFNLCNQNALWANNTSKDLDFQVLQPPINYNLLDFLLGFIILVILATCIFSCYYKYRMRRDGFPPFSAPGCCPSFMFPLPTYIEADYASINNGMIPLRILRASD